MIKKYIYIIYMYMCSQWSSNLFMIVEHSSFFYSIINNNINNSKNTITHTAIDALKIHWKRCMSVQ